MRVIHAVEWNAHLDAHDGRLALAHLSAAPVAAPRLPHHARQDRHACASTAPAHVLPLTASELVHSRRTPTGTVGLSVKTSAIAYEGISLNRYTRCAPR